MNENDGPEVEMPFKQAHAVTNMRQMQELIQAARGDREPDLLLINGRVINVFTSEIVDCPLAVSGGYIVGTAPVAAKHVVDLAGQIVAPGFIDAHVHIESAMTCAAEFARAVLPQGTTTVVADPHEIANVLGAAGIEYMLRSSRGLPLNVFLTLSSCVPATSLETAGAFLGVEALKPFLGHERIVALAELMDFPGVIQGRPEVLAKVIAARRHRLPVDGHAPGLAGAPLAAYIAAGISSDHECATLQEAKEKLAAGMHVMIREGSGARNLKDLLPLVNPGTARRIMWCTDDRHPHHLLNEGHIDSIIREAIGSGLDPITAIQMATLNPAEYFGLQTVGALAPGRRADMVMLTDLATLDIRQVYSQGILVAEEGTMVANAPSPAPTPAPTSMNLRLRRLDFDVPAAGRLMRVIEIVPDQIITKQRLMLATVADGMAVADVKRDVLKLAVVERHRGSERVGIGFVHGMGLKHGALASSVAHDSHNIIVVGANDHDMHTAVAAVAQMGGGLAAVRDGQRCHSVPLPIAGLMSYEPIGMVQRQLDGVIQCAHEWGACPPDPFMTLSFLALPVIPDLKLTDHGLVDVGRFELVPLFSA